MLGAIIGDIAGSRFEFHNYKKKGPFQLLHPSCRPTDDSVMTLAVAEAILRCQGNYSALGEQAVRSMRTLGRLYPRAGYGGMFSRWLQSNSDGPYYSYGNGAAMRVSPCGWAAGSIEEVAELSYLVTGVTHNHPEGLKGGEAIAVSIYLIRQGCSIPELREYISRHYYVLDFTLDQIRPSYRFDVSCQGSVPQAITAFLESNSFEDTIRNAISIGGDSDTIAAMAGSIAEAYYGIPEELRSGALAFLDAGQKEILNRFESTFPN